MYATNKNIKIHDFGNICRTCLHNIDLKPIHDYVLIEILHKIADITYIQNDGYPQQICENCVRKIYEIKAFAVQCKEIDFILNKCIIDSKTECFEESFSLEQNIPLEPIVIKEEPHDADEPTNITNQVKPNEEMELVSSFKDHKHFLAMETEESSSNEDFHQQYITKVNYHRSLLKNTSMCQTDAQHNPTSSNIAETSETSDEDRPGSSYSSISSKEEKSILKQMLKNKEQQQPEEKETSDLTYECGLCLKQFYQLNQFISHQSEHSDRSLFKCDLCNEEFSDYASVKEHKKVHISGEKFQCLICFKNFKDATYLIRHGRVHGNRPFKCDQCDKSYIESGHLVVHKRTHTGERPFQCESCPKAFVSLSNLVKHRVVHTGLRKIFTCDICGKEMNDPSNLRKHRRVHTKEKPFKCKYCEAAFSGASDLRAHERLHTGERPYACDMCGRKFSRSTYLTKHKKTCVELLRHVKNEEVAEVPPPQDATAAFVKSETGRADHVKMETVE